VPGRRSMRSMTVLTGLLTFLDQERRGVDPETSTAEPELEHGDLLYLLLLYLLADRRVVGVQIGLKPVEPVPVPGVRHVVPGSRLVLHPGEHHPLEPVRGLGSARRARALPRRAGAGRSRDVGGIPGAVPGRRRRGRERLRRSGHRQPVRRQPAGGARNPRQGDLYLFRVRPRRPQHPGGRRGRRIGLRRQLPGRARLFHRAGRVTTCGRPAGHTTAPTSCWSGSAWPRRPAGSRPSSAVP
jgi:hypothetical protein